MRFFSSVKKTHYLSNRFGAASLQQTYMNSWPAEECAPIEREAENELRPVGEPLHQRIEDDETHRAGAEQDGIPVELEQNEEAEAKLAGEKD